MKFAVTFDLRPSGPLTGSLYHMYVLKYLYMQHVQRRCALLCRLKLQYLCLQPEKSLFLKNSWRLLGAYNNGVADTTRTALS